MTLCLQYLIVYHQATNHVDRQTVRAFSGILGLRTGNLMIYLHYFILFGISLFTVALKFISEESAQPLFTAGCLYGGTALFYIGLWLANHYNRIIINGRVVSFFIATTIAGFLVASFWPSFATFTISIAVVTLVNAACLTSHMLKHNN